VCIDNYKIDSEYRIANAARLTGRLFQRMAEKSIKAITAEKLDLDHNPETH